MSMKIKIIIASLLLVEIILLAIVFLGDANIQILNPKGPIAKAQKDLIITVVGLMSLIAIPVYFMTFFVAYKYRSSNKKAKYDPDLKHGKIVETLWWVVPLSVVLVLATVVWKSTHKLDPQRAIASSVKPLTIQVVALQWKWLFIYPEQNIATVNFIQFPENTPINFKLSADAPMNAFWIPQLGGMIYAMTGMSTQLNLMADTIGDFKGSAAEISGHGFSGMNFIARSSSTADFNAWVKKVKTEKRSLDTQEYSRLVKPSENNDVVLYYPVKNDLYNEIIMKFMEIPTSTTHKMSH